MDVAGGFHRARNRLRAGLAGALILAAAAPGAWGLLLQMGGTIAPPTADDAATNSVGFQVPKEDSKTLDKLDDFNRYAKKKSWELAFRTMNSLAGEGPGARADAAAMVPTGNGFLLPLRRRLAQSLTNLPVDGRDAYRLFYDAEAKDLWDKIQDGRISEGPEELRALERITSHFFLTSVGDLAADRLGDLLFERGDFGAAEDAWARIVRAYPDTHLSVARLQVKRCVALARLGNHEALQALVQIIADQYADQNMTLGGEQIIAGPFVKELLATLPPPPSTVAEATPQALHLTGAQLAWKIQLLPPGTLAKMDDLIRNRGWGYMGAQFAGTVQGAAISGKTLYANCMGVTYAADLDTGLMRWRTGKFSDIPTQTITFVQYGVDTSRFALSVAGGKVFSMMQEAPNGNGQMQLHCLDAKTGQVLWRGDRLGISSPSLPHVVGNTGYCVGVAGESAVLIAFNMDTGTPVWRVTLGKFQATTNYRGQQSVPEVAMAAAPGMLYVATNNGALLAVDTAQRRVDWAFKNDTKYISSDRGGWSDDASKPFETPCALLLHGGTLYLKDTGARLMYAINPEGPTLKWSRVVDSDATIAAVRGSTAFLLGQSFSVLDLVTGQLRGSINLPLSNGNVRPIISSHDVYVSTQRGIYDLDPAHLDQAPRIFRGVGSDAAGGRLFLAGDRLINVSDEVITAYKLPASNDAGKNTQ